MGKNMSLMRLLSCAALLVMSATVWGVTVDTPYGESSIDIKLHKVKDAPVYYIIGRSGVPGADNEGLTSNAGFVVQGGGGLRLAGYSGTGLPHVAENT